MILLRCALCVRVFVSRLSIFFHRCGRVFVNILVQRWMRMTEERPSELFCIRHILNYWRLNIVLVSGQPGRSLHAYQE